jgi:citrate synthase
MQQKMGSRKVGEAELRVEGAVLPLDIIEGSEGERAIDIRNLRSKTGLITYDPGYGNSGACQSSITYIDGEKGILRYRGYDIADLAEHCTFVEVAYLIIHDRFPRKDELRVFSRLLNRHSMIHEGMHTFFAGYPERAHPMAILSAMVVSLSSFYPELGDPKEDIDLAATRLLSQLRTLAAFSYKKSIGEPHVYPSSNLTYCENFLNMMFSSPVADYRIEPVAVRAMNKLLILHADHEQNCSTSAVRLVGSSEANLYASVASGICALWGPLHGGANQAVVEMLEQIRADGGNVDHAIAKAKDKNSGFRLMGFGHRVYKTYDPRAKIAKACCKEVLQIFNTKDALLDIAMELEEKALADSYFRERNLYPNIDFYTGLTYRALGFPTNMFTVLFALGRMPGWIAQWQEQKNDADQKIGRPRQVYTGEPVRSFVPLDQRG